MARKPEPGLDGILFPSVQSPGEHRNVVLFHHTSRVEPLDIPEGTKLSARQFDYTEDGDEPDYSVWEDVPPIPEKVKKPDDDFGLMAMLDAPIFDSDEDVREPALRVKTKAVTAHHITGVTFSTDDFEVSRHRMTKREWKFTKPVKLDLGDVDF
ncbi:RES domain-containing protein [Sphingopyxis bauzanensis]|uniref:RES domain-containing protein n=1 Tax=Sphingopyxis bauzanensis TaxID=651663 RepID=UPI001F3C4460|nr:RES domain-containing protein [Sphingopyxis bauzanensis]